MTQLTLANMGSLELSQASMVVRDLEKTLRNYQQILGIGYWETHDIDANRLPIMTYHGRPAKHEFRVAHTIVGQMQLELIQPLEGKNIFSDFLAEHEQGLHHMGHLKVPDLDKAIKAFESKGFECLQSGRSEIGGYAYIDTTMALGTIIELVRQSQRARIESKTTELDIAITDGLNLRQIGIVVHDLDETLRHYQQVLGIGLWKTHKIDDAAVAIMTYHGRPAKHKFRIALAMVGQVQLEVIQPLEGENIFSDFLEEHGPGLHHMGHLKVPDLDEAIKAFESKGFECLQSGRSVSGGYAFMDTIHALGAIVESGFGFFDLK